MKLLTNYALMIYLFVLYCMVVYFSANLTEVRENNIFYEIKSLFSWIPIFVQPKPKSDLTLGFVSKFLLCQILSEPNQAGFKASHILTQVLKPQRSSNDPIPM